MLESASEKLDNETAYRQYSDVPANEDDLAANKALALEAQGVFHWLKTCLPFAFEEEFSADHRRFWELWFSILLRIREQKKYISTGLPIPEKHLIPAKETVILLILGRGLGKSATIEASAVMRGAILKEGYSLYVCEAQDQADEHISSCRSLIESNESRLTEFYPFMQVSEGETLEGIKTKDKADIFVTIGGWICRGKGLDAKMRGLRIGKRRPDDLNIDDVDDTTDSIAVSTNKLKKLTAKVFPVRARRHTTIKFGQNLIVENGVMNQIYTGYSDALAERTVIGVSNTFESFEKGIDYESYIDEKDQRLRHRILPAAVSTWSGVSIADAQSFLNDSGLDTFYAEYMNQLDRDKSGKVIPEYNEKAQIITWSMFEAMYGQAEIPRHWTVKVGLDVGYSEGQHPHYSGWVFIATSAMNSPLPNKLFLYRARAFSGTSIDDQATIIKSEIAGEFNQVISWQMSHEKTGEMMTLRQKYQIPFHKFSHYKAEDGVAQWRHLSRSDKTKPHPFKTDKLNVEGKYEIGAPELFYVVDDDQLLAPRDDKGLRLFREQVSTWEYVPVKLTDQGQTAQKPSKINDDLCDATKGVLALWGAQPTALTKAEKLEEKMPEQLKVDVLQDMPNSNEKDQLLTRRRMEEQRLNKDLNKPVRPISSTRFARR